MVYFVINNMCTPLKSQMASFDKASLKSKSQVYSAPGNTPFIAFIRSLFQTLPGRQASKRKMTRDSGRKRKAKQLRSIGLNTSLLRTFPTYTLYTVNMLWEIVNFTKGSFLKPALYCTLSIPHCYYNMRVQTTTQDFRCVLHLFPCFYLSGMLYIKYQHVESL